MKVFVGEIEFDSKKDLRKFIKERINNATGTYRIIPDTIFFKSLIRKHPNFEEKTKNKEIDHFYTKPNRFNKDTLYVKFKDGSMIDFSWVKCITGKGTDNETKLNIAMRNAIEHQIDYFKLERKTKINICHICGKEVTSNQYYHVDHVIKFSVLKRYFLKNTKREIPNKFVEKIGYYFTYEDKDFCEEWKDFHYENSILCITHEKCNLGRK